MKERGGKIGAFWEREENKEGAFQGGRILGEWERKELRGVMFFSWKTEAWKREANAGAVVLLAILVNPLNVAEVCVLCCFDFYILKSLTPRRISCYSILILIFWDVHLANQHFILQCFSLSFMWFWRFQFLVLLIISVCIDFFFFFFFRYNLILGFPLIFWDPNCLNDLHMLILFIVCLICLYLIFQSSLLGCLKI